MNSADPTGHVALAFAGTAYAIAGANAWNPVGWIIAGVATVIIIVVAYSDHTKNKTKTKAKKKTKQTGKEKASDAPEWAKRERPRKGERAEEFTKRILDKKYGKNNYRKGPSSEYSKIKKWATRALGLK